MNNDRLGCENNITSFFSSQKIQLSLRLSFLFASTDSISQNAQCVIAYSIALLVVDGFISLLFSIRVCWLLIELRSFLRSMNIRKRLNRYSNCLLGSCLPFDKTDTFVFREIYRILRGRK